MSQLHMRVPSVLCLSIIRLPWKRLMVKHTCPFPCGFAKFEDYADAAVPGWTAAQKLAMLKLYLDGPARQRFDEFLPAEKDTYERAKTKLKNVFESPKIRSVAGENLSRCRQQAGEKFLILLIGLQIWCNLRQLGRPLKPLQTGYATNSWTAFSLLYRFTFAMRTLTILMTLVKKPSKQRTRYYVPMQCPIRSFKHYRMRQLLSIGIL